MRSAAVIVLVLALVATQHTLAQEPLPPQPAQPGAAPAAPQAPQPAPAARAPQAPRPASPAQPARPVTPAPGSAPPAPAPFVRVEPDSPGQLVNIQFDIRIAEEASGQPSVTKTVTLTVADRQTGSSRTSDRSPEGVAILNVDVYPVVQKNGHVMTRIGLEYQNVKEQPSVQLRAQPLLESGKGLRVSRSVSPTGNRAVTVDVTATILK